MNASEAQLAQIKRTKILIVDDLPENLQVLGNTLREYGFQISFATNGKQALSIAAAKLPHLILLDMSMPDMDGLAVCRKIKENPQTKNIPVVFLTARTEADSIMKALKSGGTDYVVKPFNTSELISRIVLHLGLDKLTSAENSQAFITRIVEMLEGDYMEKWKSAQAGLFIDDVISFAKSISELGKESSLKVLIDFGEDLQKNADQLNIEKMSKLMDQYPLVIQKIAK
ncbi:MAG: response regulator [Ignavibacteriales bacterium]